MKMNDLLIAISVLSVSPFLAYDAWACLAPQGGTNGTLTLPTPTTVGVTPKPIPITSLTVNAVGTGASVTGYLQITVSQITTGTGTAQTTLYLSLTSNQVQQLYGMMFPVTAHATPRLTGAPASHVWTPFKGGLMVSTGMPSYRGSVAVPASGLLRVQSPAGSPAVPAQYVIPLASMNQIVNAFGAVLGK